MFAVVSGITIQFIVNLITPFTAGSYPELKGLEIVISLSSKAQFAPVLRASRTVIAHVPEAIEKSFGRVITISELDVKEWRGISSNYTSVSVCTVLSLAIALSTEKSPHAATKINYEVF